MHLGVVNNYISRKSNSFVQARKQLPRCKIMVLWQSEKSCAGDVQDAITFTSEFLRENIICLL